MADDINIDIGDSARQVRELTAELKNLKKEFTGVQEGAKRTKDETAKASKEMSTMGRSMKDAAKSAGGMASSMEVSTEAVKGMITQIGNIIPIIGPAVAAATNFFYQIDKNSRIAKFQLSQLGIAFGEVGRNIQSQTGTYFQLRNTAVQLGMSFEELKDQAISMSQFMNKKDMLGDGAKELKEFSRMAAGTGLSTDMLGRITEQSYRRMGLSTDVAYKSVAQFHSLAGKFRLNINKIADDIYNAAAGMELLGIKGRDITPVYNTFLAVLGKGREHLAGDLTKSFVQGIGKMSESFKAFFGVMGGLGGGNTLGAMFDFETMFETGQISKLGSMIGNSLVETTGAGLMTKQEAINSGQEQSFYMQRKLIEQSFGVGFKEAEEISKVLQQAKSGEITDVEAQASIKDLQKTGQDQLGARMNELDRAINKLIIRGEAKATEIISAMAKTVDAFSKGFEEGGIVQAIADASKELAKPFAPLFDWAFQKLYDVFDIFIDNLKKAFPSWATGGEKKSAPPISSTAGYRMMEPEARQKLLKTADEQINMRRYGQPGLQEWQDIRGRVGVANASTKKHDGSPGFMYSLPQLDFGEGLSVVKQDEKVLTSSQASRVQQSVGAARQQSGSQTIKVETLCRSCLSKVIADGVHTTIKQSQYSEG